MINLNRMGMDALKDRNVFLDNIERIHITEKGIDRIRQNLALDTVDVVAYCKAKVSDPNCDIVRQGKNLYCEIDGIRITISVHRYTIITAHRI